VLVDWMMSVGGCGCWLTLVDVYIGGCWQMWMFVDLNDGG